MNGNKFFTTLYIYRGYTYEYHDFGTKGSGPRITHCILKPDNHREYLFFSSSVIMKEDEFRVIIDKRIEEGHDYQASSNLELDI